MGLVMKKMLRITWGLELMQQHNSNWLHMSTGSRCWMHWMWYGYIPSVCNDHQTLRVQDSTSGLNSRANSESEMSYAICTHGSDLRRLLSLEQLKCSRCVQGGRSHVKRPVVLQIANRTVNINMSFSYEEYFNVHFMHRVCNGNTTAAVKEYQLWYPWWQIPDRSTFTCVQQHLRVKGFFPSVNRRAESQIQQMCRKMKTLLTWYSKVHALEHEEFLPSPVFHTWESGVYYTQKECIHTATSTFGILNMRTCVASWNCAIGLILTPIWFVTFCSPTRPILPTMESTI